MTSRDLKLVQTLLTFTLFGAFAGMAFLTWLMFFDASSIGTLAKTAAGPSVFSTFVIGGSMMKGGLVGFVIGLAWTGLAQRNATGTAVR